MHFGSDNQTGASAQVLDFIQLANNGYAHGYGEDDWTHLAVQALRETFQYDLESFFVATGTAANSLALSCLVHPWESILCHHQAHIFIDESTAPEFFSGGARLISINNFAGKIAPQHVQEYIRVAGTDYPHNPRAGALSFAQSSEFGLVYSPQEVSSLSAAAHEQNIFVHMDGARFANAVASLGCHPSEITWRSGVDVMSLGATKNGAFAAEAVIFFNTDLAASFRERRKRSGHLVSKSRLFGAQFCGWLNNDHWLELARHANQQAAYLAETVSKIPGFQLAWPVQANEVFLILPKTKASELQAAGASFYEWYPQGLPLNTILREDEAFIRLVTSFATTDEDIASFFAIARK